MTTELSDFTSHHIEGIAREGNIPFSVPLYSQIDGNLWMSGCPRGSAPEQFKFIVCLYPWETYAVREHQIHTQAQLFDSAAVPNEGVLLALARYVNEARKVAPTLVHCQAGLNRSGLISALALIESGKTPDEAIGLLREKRCSAVLCNKAFDSWLRSRA